MSRSKFIVTPFAPLVLVFVWAAAPATGGGGAAAAGISSEPCAPILTNPPPTTDPKPAAPTNLKILGGSGTDEAFEAVVEREFEVTSGPYAWPEMPEAMSTSGATAYFEMLTARPDCLTSFHFRSQANIDLVKSRSEADTKIPIVYDAKHDAAKFEIDPSGSLPNSGSTGTPQKRIPIHVQGSNTMLVTWDLKIAASMASVAGASEQRLVDGVLKTVKYLDQHKSHRLDDRSEAPWLGFKQDYLKAANRQDGVANYFFSAQQQYMGTGTMRGGSETVARMGPDGKAIMPPDFFVQPETWTRVYVFVDGNIGVGDRTCRLSVWMADENRAPVQIYDRINMISPESGIGIFRFEFDSSTKVALNGPGQQWQRNLVVLKGTTHAQVLSLLQKPVK